MRCLVLITAVLAVTCVHAIVNVSLPAPQVTKTDGETRTIQPIHLANEVASYGLTYDYNTNMDRPNEATSQWWGWTEGFIPIGMTQPSQANWYWQAFFNWYIGDEDLSKRPAALRVVRGGGEDGVIELLWDTPKVTARVYFAMTSGSDKLLMFGQYEPKVPIARSYLTFSCYPSGFDDPYNRAVTTAAGTTPAGGQVKLDLSKERWVLYEDVTPDRPGSGSAGLLIGTANAVESITVPVGSYGTITTVELRPEARTFGLGLYDFPSIPEYETTREYFRRSADSEAEAIGRMAAAGLERPLPAMPLEPQRLALIQAGQQTFLNRPSELWRPISGGSAWARKLGDGPVRAALYVPRWRAWETMRLAGALPMDVEHLYFDGESFLSNGEYWPYAATTGIGPIPYGVAMQRAAAMAQDPTREVFIVACVHGEAIPELVRQEIAKQVQAGKGLLLIGPDWREGWPAEMLASPDAAAAEEALDGLDWEQVPGFREGDRGRVGNLFEVFDYGQGRVACLRLTPTTYGCVVPANDAVEDQDGIMDRAMAVAAQAVLAASGRRLADTEARTATISARLVDDLGNVRYTGEAEGTQPEFRFEMRAPAGRTHVMEYIVADGNGAALRWGFKYLPAAPSSITDIQLPSMPQPPEVLTPKVNLPRGGKMRVSAHLDKAAPRSTVVFTCHDAFGRLLARATRPAVVGTVGAELTLPRPVTVSHYLDVALMQGEQCEALERKRFAMVVPYPYDDFTALLWSYAGGDPVVHRTDRLCYDWGADMMDLCHVGGFDDARAAREYELSSQSGLRLVPYVTRIAGTGNERHERVPCLHDPDYLSSTSAAIATTSRQAQAFSPAAYTLGDENYLFDGQEVCHRPESVAEFQKWLQAKYGDIATLNAAWGTNHATFAETGTPMLLPQAAEQQFSFAPWLDHKLFMSEAFSNTHDTFRDVIRQVDPAAKVGYDGFLGFNWQSGYDFERLARNLELNQTYTGNWIQGELIRAFKRPDALTGKWGNSDADNEAGWHAFPWHCLLDDDNSVWWWTSWGCDYTPFNPDLTQNRFGQWFFESVRETASGPGKLLLHANRELSPVGILHSQTDFYFGDVLAEMGSRGPHVAGGQYLNEESGIMRGVRDLGYQYQTVTPAQLARAPLDPAKCRLLFLPYASCLSDATVVNLRQYVEEGGTLVVDGRAGLLTGHGKLRDARPLDELLGVRSAAGIEALKQPATSGPIANEMAYLHGTEAEVPLSFVDQQATVLEPGLQLTTGKALAHVGQEPIVIVNAVGQGRAITLNVPLADINADRTKAGISVAEGIIAALLTASVPPGPAEVLDRDSDEAPLCVNTVHYSDGDLRYLAVMQDFLMRGLPAQNLSIGLREPAVVYDLRAGKRIGEGKVDRLDLTIERGYPVVYSLLPYSVAGVNAAVSRPTATGSVDVTVAVKPASGQAGYHVVRLDVYAPDSKTPHRQYSRNIGCPAGRGTTNIPFALSDPRGGWRLLWRDVASGVRGETVLKR